MRRSKFALAASALVLLGLPAGATAQGFAPCKTAKGAECGTVTVPLDHTGQVPGTLKLNVRRVPAASGTPARTVLLLAGGPGEAGIPVLSTLPVAELYGRDSELVVLDQRGTGRSGVLVCPAVERGTPGTASFAKAVAACGAELGPAAGLYTTFQTTADLEAVRTALGREQLVVQGSSYGGKVAGEYARRYPTRVSRLILDSGSPQVQEDPATPIQSQVAQRVVRDLCAPGRCAFPGRLDALLARALDRLGKGRRVPVTSATGRVRRVKLTAEAVLTVLSQLDVTPPAVRAQFAQAVAAGAAGDFAPLGRVLGASSASAPEPEPEPELLSQALTFATRCSETTLPWSVDSDPATREGLAEAAVEAAAPQPLLPNELGPNFTLIASCLGWPAVRPSPPAGPAPDVPVLGLAGTDDLRTPVEVTRSEVAQFPRGTAVVVPGAGHTVLGSPSECAVQAVVAFVADQPVPGCEAEAPTAVAPIPPPARPARGRRAVLAAVDASLADLLLDLDASIAEASRRSLTGGGLRGGRYALTLKSGRLALDALEQAEGVRLTGTLRLTRAGRLVGRLAVDGPGSVDGTVRLLANGRVQASLQGQSTDAGGRG